MQTSNRTSTEATPVDFSNAGGGTAVVLLYLSLIPGFAPTLALTVLVVVVIALPALVIGLAAAVVIGPPYAIWRLLSRRRRRTRSDQPRPLASAVRADRPAAPVPRSGIRSQLPLPARSGGPERQRIDRVREEVAI